jgi:ribosomal protein S12 methylthiotransferase
VYSAGLSERLVEIVAREPRIVPYIDMPIQHGSDRMLERMRRPERQDTIRRKLAWLREAAPDIAIRSTSIVGFPGETEDDFRILCEFADEIALERLGIFSYSPQEGTRAAEYVDDVPDDIKASRLEELSELQRAISADRLSRYLGRETVVLVDEATDPTDGGHTHVGRIPWQADDVDGVTRVSQGGWGRPGEFLRVRLDECEDLDFEATALP